MGDRRLSKSELVREFNIQLSLMTKLCEIYDSGEKLISKDLSAKMRILFHNKGRSKALLSTLKLDHLKFVDTSSEYDSHNLFSYSGLVHIDNLFTDNGVITEFAPHLEHGLRNRRLVTFSDWWSSSIVIKDTFKSTFTRMDLVLKLAEQDGGAHVDSEVGNDYYQLTRENSVGWFIRDIHNNKRNLDNPVAPSIRQIAFEVFETFKGIDIDSESV